MKQLKMFSLLLCVFLFGLSFVSYVSAENEGNFLRGQYRLTLDSRGDTSLIFYLRSSGMAGIVRGTGEFQHANIDFYMMQGISELGPDPLSVGHILVTYGSDEDTYRLIVRLVMVGESKELKIKVMDAVSTFVDGPNELKDWSAEKVRLERYDPATKKWVLLG